MSKEKSLDLIFQLSKKNITNDHEIRRIRSLKLYEFLKLKKRFKQKSGFKITRQNAKMKEINSDYIAFVLNDIDVDNVCLEKMYAYALKNNADIVYSDSCIENMPHLKTDVSIDILLQGIEEFDVLLIHKNVYEMISNIFALTESEVITSNDYMLCAYLITNRIDHLAEILYQTVPITKREPIFAQYYKNANLKMNNGKVSIIIPTKDKIELLDQCIQSILDKTTYLNYEIIIINNRSIEQESLLYFEKIQCENIKVINADIEFNWSKLNNIGIQNSDADVFVFLNNDTKIIEKHWLDNMVSNCARADVGIVGGLLLYEDDTIQHAGVVVGLIDFADHLYKGENIHDESTIFYHPCIKRNVLAVTGACMGISRSTIDKIGFFNEDFIICGSDVEICLRAYKQGLNNVYDPKIKLYHLESKSRDSYIPPIDFELSKKFYEPYRSKGDPFYHPMLDNKSCVPIMKEKYNEKIYKKNIEKIKNH